MAIKEPNIKALVFIIFVIAVNAAFLLQDFEFSRYAVGRDLVTIYDRRFDELRSSLPDSGMVGYATDKEPQQVFSDSYAIQRFYLTRYALSPLIVVNDIDHKHVVGDFHDSPPRLEQYGEKGLAVVKDYGNGVILFERRVER